MSAPDPLPRAKGELTGKHILAIFIAFFGVIIAVNLYMATQAIGTFGGVVVDNSYVASQKYNGWLAEARAQKELGWEEQVIRGSDGTLTVTVTDALKAPLAGASINVLARHPLGRAPELDIAFTEVAPGQYRAATPLPAGRWQVHVTIQQGGRTKNLLLDMNEKSGSRER